MYSIVFIPHGGRKHGYRCSIARYTARLHARVLLYLSNWSSHIKAHHPEMTLEIIGDVLDEPDHVFKPSKNSKEFYYQKTIAGTEYRVVIRHDGNNTKAVVTAYAIERADRCDWHEIYMCYPDPDGCEASEWDHPEKTIAEYELRTLTASA